LDALDPRKILRLITLYQMKDRAGVVGTRGVGPLLHDVLRSKPAATRVHLLGHSYGGKVVLSAVHALPGGAPTVQSVLLLEPAVNAWCFAPDVDGGGYPGGYHDVLDRVEGGIFTTFTKDDVPLRRVFHLAVRRPSDLGELKVAAGIRPDPPSVYAALGGFGPAGLDDATCEFLRIKVVLDHYKVNRPIKVLALNADDVITGHGDISNPSTWWALYNQVNP